MIRYWLAASFTCALVVSNESYDPCKKTTAGNHAWYLKHQEATLIFAALFWPATLGAVAGEVLGEYHHERCTP